MRILMLGDVVGRAGRMAVIEQLPVMRREMKLDFIMVNADNAAGGFGSTPDCCESLFKAGADVITGGDHVWDQKDLRPYISTQKKLLRPVNFPASAPGYGTYLTTLADGRKILTIHLLGQIFMPDHLDCPFAAIDRIMAEHRLGANQLAAIIVDFHAEATSEKMAMGVYLDGRVSAVAGSHTHVPTADQRILPKGTAYQTDMGMCGDYDSVIGFEAAQPLEIFTRKIRKVRMVPAQKTATVAGLFIETDDASGLAKKVAAVKIGGAIGDKNGWSFAV